MTKVERAGDTMGRAGRRVRREADPLLVAVQAVGGRVSDLRVIRVGRRVQVIGPGHFFFDSTHLANTSGNASTGRISNGPFAMPGCFEISSMA